MENSGKGDAPHNFVSEITNFTGKYFRFATKYYNINKNGKNTSTAWECLYRTSLVDFKTIYGTEVFALIKNEDFNPKAENFICNFSIILIENFRYPVDKKVLETPSGLIDEWETNHLEEIYKRIQDLQIENKTEDCIKAKAEYEEAVIKICKESCARELKEETGYAGKFKSFFNLPNFSSVKLFENIIYDPWKGNENSAFAIFEVDTTIDENKNPTQKLDEDEIIQVHIVKLSELLEFISNKITQEGYACSSHLYTFAMGLKFSEYLKTIFNN
jgi:hypothetical protein